MAKKVKRTRNRKPGLQSTDGMVKKVAYKKVGVRNESVDEYSEHKILNKGGLEKLFKTPESLWKAACDYFNWARNNPWLKNEYKDGRIVKIPVGRPLTIIGMCVHMGANSDYYRTFKNGLSVEERELFDPVIKKIDDTIYTQKFEGAAIGAFNANIISRDLGLIDRSSVDIDDNRKAVSDLFPEDLGKDVKKKI